MLRSKNVRKVLEQVLTPEICLCAIFNEEGVVLAHAAENDFDIADLRREALRASSLSKIKSGNIDMTGLEKRGGSHGSRGISQGSSSANHHNSQLAQSNTRGSSSGGNGRAGNFASPTNAAGHVHGSEIGSGTSATHLAQLEARGEMGVDSAGAMNIGYGEANYNPLQELGPDSSLVSFGDDLMGYSPQMRARERLDDCLAIAASLWQSYENMAGLIEHKEKETDDEFVDDSSTDMQDVIDGNDLHMAIIECEYGNAAVTKVGVFRLFLLGRPKAPLGMLRLKSDNLRRFLEETLNAAMIQ